MFATPIVLLPLYIWYEINVCKEDGRVRTDIVDTKDHPHNYLWSGIYFQPHLKKVEKGGEDAYFITEDDSVVGMADGVGGWNKKGIDPALFSNELCANFKQIYQN